MSPKEIAEEILEAIKVPSKYTALYYEQQKLFALARAYLELEKLKKSREVLRSAFEVIARGESQFDNVDHMYTAREALKADSEIMEGK